LPASVTSTQALTPPAAGSVNTPIYYQISTLSASLTVNPILSGTPPLPVDTYVAIRVTGDLSGSNAAITVNPKVHLKIYFEGNISMQNNIIVNRSPSALNPYAG